jgi:ketosteroid isomerase-like protein
MFLRADDLDHSALRDTAAVSQDNADIVRRWSDAWARQDVLDIAACFNDEIEVDFSNAEGPFRGVYRGPDDVIRFIRSLWEAWDEVTIEPEAMFECGDDCLVTANVLRAKGRASGIEVQARSANLWTFRQGKISGVKLFQTTDEAQAAAALRRPAGSPGP